MYCLCDRGHDSGTDGWTTWLISFDLGAACGMLKTSSLSARRPAVESMHRPVRKLLGGMHLTGRFVSVTIRDRTPALAVTARGV
jgi:hypothetical protein